jgi:30S ribosomal protein S31
MGKGDKRTKKGKIFRGSFGKTRPGRRPKKAGPVPAAAATPAPAAKKASPATRKKAAAPAE